MCHRRASSQLKRTQWLHVTDAIVDLGSDVTRLCRERVISTEVALAAIAQLKQEQPTYRLGNHLPLRAILVQNRHHGRRRSIGVLRGRPDEAELGIVGCEYGERRPERIETEGTV